MRAVRNKNFTDFLRNENIANFSRYTSTGAVFDKIFFRTFPDLLKTPASASPENNEGYVYHNFSNERKKLKPKYKSGDLVGAADEKNRLPQKGINKIGPTSNTQL